MSIYSAREFRSHAALTGDFCTGQSEREITKSPAGYAKQLDMPNKKYKPEQVVTLPRQIEAELADGFLAGRSFSSDKKTVARSAYPSRASPERAFASPFRPG